MAGHRRIFPLPDMFLVGANPASNGPHSDGDEARAVIAAWLEVDPATFDVEI